jgi:hypothetical protein
VCLDRGSDACEKGHCARVDASTPNVTSGPGP